MLLQGDMIAWAFLVALVSLTTTVAGFTCPQECICGDSDSEREYNCPAGAGNIIIRAVPNDYVKISCQDGLISWSHMPFIQVSQNDSLSSISISSCPLLPLRELLGKLGAADVQVITLDGALGVFTADHVEGLKEPTMLVLLNAADQKAIPYGVLSSLPAIRDFRLRGASIHLESDNETFPIAPSLHSLELSGDHIATLPPGVFQRLPNLKLLHLWRNDIGNISSEAFLGLEGLEQLDLSQNPLRVLPGGVFARVPRLRRLTLVATALTDVQEGAFQGMKFLEEIIIKFGNGTITFAPRALSSLPAFKKLTLDRCSLSPLPEDLLKDTETLEELIITGTGLEDLPPSLLKNQKKLKVLDLKENRLRSLEFDVFWSLGALEKLILDDNNIEELPGQIFTGLKNLKLVSINNNKLKTIARDSFLGANNLQHVALANNLLTLRPGEQREDQYSELAAQSPFHSLLNLAILDLKDNRISDMFSDWRMVLVTNLKKLDLSGNSFRELTKADVQFLSNSIQVDLRRNNISTIEVLEAPSWWPQEPSPTSAVILLDENPFRCDCELYSFIRRLKGSKPIAAEPRLEVGQARCRSPPSFSGRLLTTVSSENLVCNLRDIDCPSNCTCALRPSSSTLELDCVTEPSKYPTPSDFGMSESKLRLQIPPDTLDSLPGHVVSLNLSNSGVQSINDLPKTIKEIDLSKNLLQSIPKNVLNANVTLYLEGNPFICDCWHAKDIKMMQININKVVDYENVMCNVKEAIWRVDSSRLCDVRRAGLLGGALAGVGVLATVVAILAYRYALEIKVFLFSRGWCMSLVTDDELEKDARYDAFVSFSQQDAKWVVEELVPKLEGDPNNLKLCVHYRDWVVGDMIPTQIARSVEQSRRTIVVLSESFLKSIWAPLEFRAAHLRSQKERRQRVLVVILEDLPADCEVDEELRAYLNTNTYLKWGDPWFWEKLLYALPHKRSRYDNRGFIPDKLERGSLATRLTSDGKIVNDANQPAKAL